jgi:hypothetical protein
MIVPQNATKITVDYLATVKPRYLNAGYNIPKWIIFSEVMLVNGYKVYLWESKSTVSKYVFITKENNTLKIRFSNHKPNKLRELNNDCDIYVGVGHLGVCTTEQVIEFILNK